MGKAEKTYTIREAHECLKGLFATSTNYLVPEDAGDGVLRFRLDRNQDGYYDYDAVKRLPSVVEYRGRLYRRSGWNSDSGHAYYKPVAREDLAIGK